MTTQLRNGKPHTDEAKAKISAAVTAYWARNRAEAAARGEKMRASRATTPRVCLYCPAEFNAYRRTALTCADCRWKRILHTQLMINYGISYEQYTEMLDAQGGVCKICGSTNKVQRLCVDHDGKTGQVRGLLCHECNKGLGSFRDNPQIMQAAIEYIHAAAKTADAMTER